METKIIGVEKDDETQLILGHAGFIKTAEDIYEAMLNAVPNIKFGVAFAEASGKKLIRTEGNDEALIALAAKNMLAIGAGHTFIILFHGAYPINVVKHLRDICEVVAIYCATANAVKVVVADDGEGRSILGIIDGQTPTSIETPADKTERHDLLRKIGYKK